MSLDVKPLVVVDVGFWTALFYGLLAFFTPCMLVLLPFLFSLVSARKGFFNVFLFSIGFVLTFTVMGVFSSEIGTFIPGRIMKVVTGVLVIFFGLIYMLNVTVAKGGRFLRFVLEKGEKLPPVILGIAIGLVWIPCSTPVLASILSIAAQTSQKLRGAFLLFVYSLGVLIPFLTVGGTLDRWLSSEIWKRVFRFVGGLYMVVMGIFILTGCLNFSP